MSPALWRSAVENTIGNKLDGNRQRSETRTVQPVRRKRGTRMTDWARRGPNAESNHRWLCDPP